jgi:hypothetical protein
MARIWIWDMSRKLAGTDWNVMQDVVEDVSTGHVHDGADSRKIPEAVSSLPAVSSENYGRLVELLSDGRLYFLQRP